MSNTFGTGKFYTTVVNEVDGEYVLEFLHTVIEDPVSDLGWEPGDKLKVETRDDSTIILTKIDNE
mgnify:FL=1